MTPDKRIAEFIGAHHVLTLATCAGGTLHCCNLFYAYLPQRNAFAVTSSDKTLHAAHLRENPKVAASIVLETRTIGKVQGLQIRGTMTGPSEEEKSEIRKAYLTQFPYAAVMDLDLWVIRPDYMKLTDNRLGFGKKIIWEAQNDRQD